MGTQIKRIFIKRFFIDSKNKKSSEWWSYELIDGAYYPNIGIKNLNKKDSIKILKQ